MAAARVYVAIRRCPHIVDSVFSQTVAGRHLEALIGRLTPEQPGVVHAASVPSDLRGWAMELRARLEALA